MTTFQRHVHGAWCHPAADGCPSYMPAPALSAEEAAVVARFDAAPVPAEVLEIQRRSLAGMSRATANPANDRIRAALASSAPAPRNRYAQCDDTCTVDCGACKGAGPT